MTPDICPPLQTPPVPLKSIASMLALKCGEKQLTLNVYGWQKFESRQEYYKTELSLMFAQDTKKKKQVQEADVVAAQRKAAKKQEGA